MQLSLVVSKVKGTVTEKLWEKLPILCCHWDTRATLSILSGYTSSGSQCQKIFLEFIVHIAVKGLGIKNETHFQGKPILYISSYILV